MLSCFLLGSSSLLFGGFEPTLFFLRFGESDLRSLLDRSHMFSSYNEFVSRVFDHLCVVSSETSTQLFGFLVST